MDKMTQREFLNKVANGEIDDEVKDFATARIAALDVTNEKRREASAKKAAEKEAVKAPIREAVFAVINEEPKTATMLIEEAGVEIKPQAIPSLLKPLINEGKVAKTDVKVKGKGSKRGYIIAQ